MTSMRPEPPEDAGINAIRLDAERTRDELERTLEEIERRLDPRPRIDAVKRAYRRSPASFIGIASGALASIGGLVAWAMVSGRKRKKHEQSRQYVVVETKMRRVRG